MILVNVCDSGNFKNYGAFDESAYSITPRHLVKLAIPMNLVILVIWVILMVLRNLITSCTLSDSGISEESGSFSDYIQSHRSDGDFGSSDVGCEEYRFLIRMNIQIYLYPKNNMNKYPNIFVSKK